jgi:YVTN family beta-propeller protein
MRADEIRRWIAAGALGLLAVAGGSRGTTGADAGAAKPGEYVYVTNEDSRNITVIDARNDRVVTTIEVGTRPRGVKVSSDGRTVYVALSGSPKCPPSMPDEECQKQKADPAKDGRGSGGRGLSEGRPHATCG